MCDSEGVALILQKVHAPANSPQYFYRMCETSVWTALISAISVKTMALSAGIYLVFGVLYISVLFSAGEGRLWKIVHWKAGGMLPWETKWEPVHTSEKLMKSAHYLYCTSMCVCVRVSAFVHIFDCCRAKPRQRRRARRRARGRRKRRSQSQREN